MRIDGFQGSILAKCFYFLAGYCGYVGFRHVMDENTSWTILLILCAAAGIFGAIGVGIDRLAAKLRQGNRDSQARLLHDEIKQNVEAGKPTWYFLFLRPFYLTRALPQRNQKQASSIPLLPAHWQDKHFDFETLLVRSINRFGPVVALGMPGEAVGAGRIEVDESEWKEQVELIGSHARGIVVIPSYRTGTMWVIDWLKNQKLFPRCLFVMPPDGFDYKIDLPGEWQKTLEHVATMGVELPPYDPQGMLFCLGDDGKPEAQAPMQAASDAEFESSVSSLLQITNDELAAQTAKLAPKKIPIEQRESVHVLFGAQLVSDCVDFFPDWSAAMQREFADLSEEKLPQMFELAERLAQQPPADRERLISDYLADK